MTVKNPKHPVFGAVDGVPVRLDGDALKSLAFPFGAVATRERKVTEGKETIGPWKNAAGKMADVKTAKQSSGCALGGGLDTAAATEDMASNYPLVLVFEDRIEGYALS